MDNKDIIYEPKQLYTDTLRQQYHDKAEEVFAKMAEDAKIDIEANRSHVKQYNSLMEKVKSLEDNLKSTKGKRTAIIVGTVLCFIFGGVMVLLGLFNLSDLWFLFIIGILLIALAIFLIVFNQKKMKKLEEEHQALLDKAKKEAQDMLNICYADLKDLNASYTWNMPASIMESVTGIIDFDPYFSLGRYAYLQKTFGYKDENSANCSVLGVLSGNIQGNPFIQEKVMQESMVSKTYTGSLTIHWTTFSRDSKGNSVAHHHSETLRASVDKPAPNYVTQTLLIYGNEFAPNLHFRRSPSDINKYKNDKEYEKAVTNGMKEVKKFEDECLKDGRNYTALANDEFEVFFKGQDRDNEVEFRLLFPALAQVNMMKLLRDPIPFGDDFYMIKDGMINTIVSKHSQSFDYSASPSMFVHYDYDAAKENFVNYSDNYIMNLFFDFAPLLCITDYQTHKTRDYIYESGFSSNYSRHEQEAVANRMDRSCFAPTGADEDLPLLIKSVSSTKVGMTDKVTIHSYCYHGTQMVDYVSVMGGDGRSHNVPVPWIKYDRVDKDTLMDLRYIGEKEEDTDEENEEKLSSILGSMTGVHFERGLFAMIDDGSIDESIESKISSIFDNEKSV